MRVIRSTTEMIAHAQALRGQGITIGLVPTMGYLHEGHLSLVRLCCMRSEHTVLSLFVNPTQFGPGEDFEKYPRDEERDFALCEENLVDTVFVPSPDEMYAPDASIWVTEDRVSSGLCGLQRPGHFTGVCTVVAKLFQIVQPHIAVFGQKDAQQVAVIRRLVRDLFFPVEVVVGPIVREASGLALSSRNVYLSESERASALGLSRTLFGIRDQWHAGICAAADLKDWACAHLAGAYPGVTLEYLVFCNADTLETVDFVSGGVLVAIAARVGRTRLIDNILL